MYPPAPWSRRLLAALLAFAVPLGVATDPRTARADGEPELRRNAVVRAVERARSSVVSIHTTRLIRRNFYGWELPPVEGQGVGSGAIFHPEGFVITNAHVIARASKVLVDITLSGGVTETHEARIFAVDIPHDLAILRLLRPETSAIGDAYPYLPLGRSDDLMVGESVIAMGNPFGIGFTVTTGVIGALHRNLRGPTSPPPPADARVAPNPDPPEQVLDDFVQIDAAINPGNSGGPLFDITGRWIGVNTAIWNRQQTAAEGIGFAVPVDQVRALVGRAFKRRLIRGDWLGVELVPGEEGRAEIRFVLPKGPARATGLMEGDRIVSLDGEPTPTLFDLRWRMAFLPQGAAVRLGVQRGDRSFPDPVVVQLLPVPTEPLSDRHLGFTAADVGDEENRNLNFSFDAGVVVREVREGSPAAAVGLRAGDLVVGLGTYRIRHTDDLLLFLQYVQPGDLVKVQVVRSTVLRGGRVLREEQEGVMMAR